MGNLTSIKKNGIRKGYWALLAATGEKKVPDEEYNPMIDPAHIRHCIDLLRHRLMCEPDITVEVKDRELGGVTGFGTKHQCKDWGELMRWTREWEGWGQESRAGGKGEQDRKGER